MSQRYELRRLMLIWMQRFFPEFHKFVSLSTHFRLLNISFLLTPLFVDQSHYQLLPIDRFGSIRIRLHQPWKLLFVMNVVISRLQKTIIITHGSRDRFQLTSTSSTFSFGSISIFSFIRSRFFPGRGWNICTLMAGWSLPRIGWSCCLIISLTVFLFKHKSDNA